MHLITNRLAVGNSEDAANPHWLMAAILNVASETKVLPPKGRRYHWIPFAEYAAADPLQLDEAVSWLETHGKGSRLLICCRAGIGRSASVAIAYLCLVEGLPYPQAAALVAAQRPGAVPLPELETTIRFVQDLRQKRLTGLNA
jgi:protein-tyrosine phosphatase